jgi:hypothetical protein
VQEASLTALAMQLRHCIKLKSLWFFELYLAGTIKAKVCVERLQLNTGLLKDVHEVWDILYAGFTEKC